MGKSKLKLEFLPKQEENVIGMLTGHRGSRVGWFVFGLPLGQLVHGCSSVSFLWRVTFLWRVSAILIVSMLYPWFPRHVLTIAPFSHLRGLWKLLADGSTLVEEAPPWFLCPTLFSGGRGSWKVLASIRSSLWINSSTELIFTRTIFAVGMNWLSYSCPLLGCTDLPRCTDGLSTNCFETAAAEPITLSGKGTGRLLLLLQLHTRTTAEGIY